MSKYQKMGKCVACQIEGFVDLHHLKTRKSGGTDHPSNLMELCRMCHSMLHQIGMTKFIGKFPYIKLLLDLKGWRFDSIAGKYVQDAKED